LITFMLSPVEIVAVCSMIITLSGAIAIVLKPFRLVKARSAELDKLKELVEKDYREREKLAESFRQRSQEQDRYNAGATRAITTLLLHAMTGNETGEMKAAYEEIRDYHLRH